MNEINHRLGLRIKQLRLKEGLSQEQLGEKSGFHYTYIGQIERGEKNATINSLAKIAKALNISLSALFENIDNKRDREDTNYPLLFYDLIDSKTIDEQEKLFAIFREICNYGPYSK